MKKILTITILSAFVTVPSIAQVNMPGEPTFGTTKPSASAQSSYYKKTNTTTNQNHYPPVDIPKINTTDSNSSNGGNASLNSMAMSVLKAAERHDEQGMNAIIQKMVKAGAEGFSTPQIISKQTPHCPPIKIEVNGKKMSGSTCGLFGYLYKGKQYDVGYCK